jgi:Flp pilus assembly protein TadD
VSAIVLLAYLPTLWHDFVWDDNRLVKNNSYLEQTNPTEIFLRGFGYNPELDRNLDTGLYYRPLTVLSFFLERKEWGLSPAGYHLTNVLLHALAAFLVCVLLRRIFGSVAAAAAGGLYFGLNPAVNSAVAWIAGRNYLLVTVLLLCAAWLMLQDLKARPLYAPLLSASLFLALLAHEAAIVFIPLVLLWIAANPRRFQPAVSWMLGILLVFGSYLLLRLAIARIPFPPGVVSDTIHQPLLLLNVYGQQVLHLFAPFAQHLYYQAAPPLTVPSVYTALGVLFLLLPAALALKKRGFQESRSLGITRESSNPQVLESSNPAAVGAAWLILFLLPAGSVMLLGPAGRTLYPAVPGVLILVLAAWDRLPVASRRLRAALLIVWAGYAIAGGVCTVKRNAVWRNELALFRQMVQETPDASGARLNLGIALQDAKRPDEAIEQYRAAIRLSPDYPEPRNKLAYLLLERNDFSEAAEQLRAVVRLEPNSAEARNDLALTLKKAGQLDSAIVEYQASLGIEPGSETTLVNLGNAYLARGDYGPAIQSFRDALRRQPNFTAARVNLALAFKAAGFPDSAEAVNRGRW